MQVSTAVTAEDGHIWRFNPLAPVATLCHHLCSKNASESVVEAFWIPPAHAEPLVAGSYVGSVNAGASVNSYNVHFCPHGNCTHSECVGHILPSQHSIIDLHPTCCIQNVAILLSVVPVSLESSGDTYLGKHEPSDLVISSRSIIEAHANVMKQFSHLASTITPRIIVIKAALDKYKVDGPDHPEFRFSGQNAPYFTYESMKWIVDNGIEHIITNLPSMDRESDGAVLMAHRMIFALPVRPLADVEAMGQEEKRAALAADEQTVSLGGCRGLVTELARIPADLVDRFYWCSLQLAPFHQDATPSVPTLYELVPDL